MGNATLNGGSAAERLEGWRAVIVNAIARTTALLFFPPVIWLLIDAKRFREPVLFWSILLFEVANVAIALFPLAWRTRARLLVCGQLLITWLVVPLSGLTGGVGALTLLMVIEAALLLGLREAVAVLSIAVFALLKVPLSILLLGAEPPRAELSSAADPAIALRVTLVISSIAVVALSSIAYMLRKLIVTLFEAEELIRTLRKEIVAREEEERRRKSAEAELIRAQKMETLGNLAGGMAHDVNNNLTVTLTCVELIERAAGDDPSTRKWCDAIRHAVENASGLTRQLLTLGRRDVSRPSNVKLAQVFERIERLLPPALGRSVRLHLELPDDLPPVLVDAGQLEQVLLNLAINARDAMPNGGELTISAELAETPQRYAFATRAEAPERPVRIRVTDTGEGIDEANLPKIVEPFYTTKGPVRGTGLGLAVARAFADASGGRLGIDSRVGQGSTFSLELPAAGVDMSPAQAQLERARARAREAVVLVVDDDVRIREGIAAALRQEGYRVLEAADGIEALEQAKAAPRIDLLCTDVVMPRLGGERLLRLFQELHREARILVCSAYVHEQKLRELLQAGHYAVLPKPFSPGELRLSVASTLA